MQVNAFGEHYKSHFGYIKWDACIECLVVVHQFTIKCK